jgi:hypothetical protein
VRANGIFPAVSDHRATVTPSSRVRLSIATTAALRRLHEPGQRVGLVVRADDEVGPPEQRAAGGGGSFSIMSRAAPASVRRPVRRRGRVGGHDGAAADRRHAQAEHMRGNGGTKSPPSGNRSPPITFPYRADRASRIGRSSAGWRPRPRHLPCSQRDRGASESSRQPQ